MVEVRFSSIAKTRCVLEPQYLRYLEKAFPNYLGCFVGAISV